MVSTHSLHIVPSIVQGRTGLGEEYHWVLLTKLLSVIKPQDSTHTVKGRVHQCTIPPDTELWYILRAVYTHHASARSQKSYALFQDLPSLLLLLRKEIPPFSPFLDLQVPACTVLGLGSVFTDVKLGGVHLLPDATRDSTCSLSTD